MLEKLMHRFLAGPPLFFVARGDLLGHPEQGRPVVGVQHDLRDSRCAEGESYGHLSLYRAVPLGVGVVVNPQTAAFSVGAAVAGRGITLSFSPNPTQWITVGEWLKAPSKVPGAKLTELVVDQFGVVRWHLWAGKEIVGRVYGAIGSSRWRRGRADLAKKLLGEPKRLEFHGKSRVRHVEMPEGKYEVTAIRRTVTETYGIGVSLQHRVVEITSKTGIPWPKNGRQDLCLEFIAETEDIRQAVGWWRDDLLRQRGGTEWRPKRPARKTGGEESGVPTWEVQNLFTGTWEPAGAKAEDQLPADWLVPPPLPIWMAAAMGAGLIGMAAYGLGLFMKKAASP
jgi:hypothetical protein